MAVAEGFDAEERKDKKRMVCCCKNKDREAGAMREGGSCRTKRWIPML
jgi:hypothetical protein